MKKSPRYGGHFDLAGSEKQLAKLEVQMTKPGFWDDQKQAALVSQQAEELRDEISTWKNIKKNIDDTIDVISEAISENDDSIKEDINKSLEAVEKEFNKLEFHILLNQPYDVRDAIIAIHTGTGGVDAQDWTEMLMRMYVRYCEKRNWKVDVVHKSAGQEAGIKSVMMTVRGRYAFGYLKAEAGVHRLVRISPFDAEKMRHTSFSLVEVIPDLGKHADIEINDKDLRIDVFKASGHGGQSVNTTDSAVRIVHLPTGITVNCQNERSQTQNKETALKILKSKLLQKKEMKRQSVEQKLRGEYQSAEWGNQIRSYVLQPYTMVKDHRTKHEVSNVEKVLDGDLDEFIEAYLKKQAEK